MLFSKVMHFLKIVGLPLKRQDESICYLFFYWDLRASLLYKAMALIILLTCEENNAPLCETQWLWLILIPVCRMDTLVVVSNFLNMNVYEGRRVHLPSHWLDICLMAVCIDFCFSCEAIFFWHILQCSFMVGTTEKSGVAERVC